MVFKPLILKRKKKLICGIFKIRLPKCGAPGAPLLGAALCVWWHRAGRLHGPCAQFSSNFFRPILLGQVSLGQFRLGLDEMDWTKKGWTKMNWTKTRSSIATIDKRRYKTAADGIIGKLYTAYSISVSAMDIQFGKFIVLIFYTD